MSTVNSLRADRRNGQVVTSRVLIVKPHGGLSNRVRVIASFQLLARYTDRAFRVCWAPSEGFSNETLDELFDNEFDQVDLAEYARSADQGPRLERFKTHRGDASGVSAISIAAMSGLGAEPILTYTGCFRLDVALRQLPDLPASFESEYRTAVRTWRPVESIRASVDSIARHFDSSTIGVHARRGDALVDPVNRGKARRSTDAAFFRRMDALLTTNRRTRFFLATDSEDTEARFLNRYGDRIHTNDAKRFVPSDFLEPKENQRDAVVDLFALARTNSILGSNASSFSQLAGAIGDVPVKRVAHHSLLHLARNKLILESQRLRRRTPAVGQGAD